MWDAGIASGNFISYKADPKILFIGMFSDPWEVGFFVCLFLPSPNTHKAEMEMERQKNDRPSTGLFSKTTALSGVGDRLKLGTQNSFWVSHMSGRVPSYLGFSAKLAEVTPVKTSAPS